MKLCLKLCLKLRVQNCEKEPVKDFEATEQGFNVFSGKFGAILQTFLRIFSG